jgi:PAS domain S-box-containing protein
MFRKINTLEQENRQLRAQLERVQSNLDKSRHVFRQIGNFSSKLGIPVEPNETYHNCLHLFKDLLDLDYATLLLHTSDPFDSLLVYDTLGFPETMVGEFTICKRLGLAGLVLESKKVETVEDFNTENRIITPDIVSKNNIHSAIAVPMFHNNELFGVLVGHTKSTTLFSRDQKSLAQIFANQAAAAINNAIHIQSLNVSENALRERSNELNSIFENSMVGIMLIKGDRIITRCNQRLADFMGYESPEEMNGLNTRILHPSEKQYLNIGESFFATLNDGRQVQQEIQLRKKDGSTLWCNILGQALDHSSPPDLTKGIVYIIYDISQRKKLEEQLLKNKKLESFAILTGGLGHDFNNIMTAILGNIDLSITVLDSENPAYSFLQSAKEATLRAKDLTAQLQSFSQVSKPILRTTSIPELIRKVTDVPLGNNIDLTSHYSEDLHEVEIDSDQISKVIENLLKNSIQAMGKGGKIHINCSNFTNQDDIAELNNGQFVQISITDNGHGISPEIEDKIFDPYFTTRTRHSEKGSGLGLATVHSIIKRHKGFISAKSDGHSETTFTFYLPVSKDKSSPNDTSAAKTPLLGGSKRKILIMDDNEDVRRVIEQMLTLIGHTVEMAPEGEMAVSLYRSAMETEAPFDVVIMDLNIPKGMGGVEATQKILQFDKNAKIIVASGDPEDPVMRAYKEYGFTTSVNKPFDFSELYNALSKSSLS